MFEVRTVGLTAQWHHLFLQLEQSQRERSSTADVHHNAGTALHRLIANSFHDQHYSRTHHNITEPRKTVSWSKHKRGQIIKGTNALREVRYVTDRRSLHSDSTPDSRSCKRGSTVKLTPSFSELCS